MGRARVFLFDAPAILLRTLKVKFFAIIWSANLRLLLSAVHANGSKYYALLLCL